MSHFSGDAIFLPVTMAGGVKGSAEIAIGKNYNGSGPQAFGGAREWPVVQLHVPFVEGQRAQAMEFRNDLAEWVAERLKKI